MVTRVSAQAAGKKVAKNVQKNVTRAVSGTLGLSGERMTKVDTAWLRMDTPSNLMMIVGVWSLQPGVSYAAVAERLENSLLKYARFKQRVIEDTAGATWVNDRNFDLKNHLIAEKLPKASKGHEQEVLQDRVAELAMQPLDRKQPLWQIHLVEDYTGPDGIKGSAMIVRIHHCIADGIALISVTMSLVDGGAPPPERRKKESSGGAEDWIAETLLKP
ncbi:MAG: wax ester/triacylglycerol synthase family O-acyltransferase, partial [Polaromonas sp.]|nr:wax ester/triacylglycerol synthase family O-acyltransferase [Polaromonas sp.]